MSNTSVRQPIRWAPAATPPHLLSPQRPCRSCTEAPGSPQYGAVDEESRARAPLMDGGGGERPAGQGMASSRDAHLDNCKFFLMMAGARPDCLPIVYPVLGRGRGAASAGDWMKAAPAYVSASRPPQRPLFTSA
jgi:hypothetical protein